MQTIAITGAAGGLGTAVVQRLEQKYRCLTPAREALDLSSETSVRQWFAEAGELYALVHLVGGFVPGKLADTTLDTWTKMLATNTTAAFLALREALPRLTRPGRIIAISSIATLTPGPGSTAYTVAKSALNTLIQTTAAELRGTGITVNAVLPDSMATPAMLAEMPAGKLVPLENVTETLAWLLSEGAAGVTGTLIPIRKMSGAPTGMP
jgi:NAD(P)-dependent dehydrogenase (short-subunit alcohol dehydrogenase family)